MDSELLKQFLKYHNDEMNVEEQKTFDDKLSSDSVFKAQFEEFSIGQIAGERIHHNEVKLSVDKIIGEESNRFKLRRYMKYAAAAVLLVTAVSLVFFLNSGQSPEAIYASYYDSPPYSSTRNGEDATDKLNQVKGKFAERDWVAVIDNIMELDSATFSDFKAQRILAHAYLKNDDNKKAIETFRSLSEESTEKSQLEDYWFLALSYLKNGDETNALIYLDRIIASDLPHSRKIEAEEIKNILE